MADISSNHDRSALERNGRPGGGIALDDDQTAVGAGAHPFGGVAIDQQPARHQVLTGGPPHETVGGNRGTVAQATQVMTGRAVDGDLDLVGQTYGKVVPPLRVGDEDACTIRQAAELGVDLAGCEFGGRQRDQTSTSSA